MLTATSKFFEKATSSPWKGQRGKGLIKLAIRLENYYEQDPRYQTRDTRTLALAKALILGDALTDDAFMFTTEKKVVEEEAMSPTGEAARFVWENSAPKTRPRRLVVANMLSYTAHFELEFWRKSDEATSPGLWTVELYDEVLFARIGVGRDPHILAREVLKWDEELSSQYDSFENAMKWVQRQAEVNDDGSEEGRPTKRARIEG